MYRNEFSTPTVVVERLRDGKSPIPVEEKGQLGPEVPVVLVDLLVLLIQLILSVHGVP